MIQWVTDQLRLSLEIDEIVIATVAEKANALLVDYARKENLSLFCYEGNVDHVTTRLRMAAEFYDADICVLVSGDCPLIHHSGIDAMVACLRQNPQADVISVEAMEDYLIQLQGVDVARRNAWQRADDLSDRPELKEHQFPVIGLLSEHFTARPCLLPENLYGPNYRLSVDTMADLEFQNRVFKELTSRKQPYGLPEVLALLKENPDIAQINSHVYHRGLVEDIKQVLFVVDAGKQFGYGHLMRSLELAAQIVERLSFPITFVVDDVKALELAKNAGFRVVRGGMNAFSGRLESGSTGQEDYEKHLAKHDLVILDIYGQRKIQAGWREQFDAQMPVVVLDVTAPWTQDADMVVVPGVTCREKQNTQDNFRLKTGKNRVILRKDIRDAQHFYGKKDLDVIAYLHDKDQRKLFRKFAQSHKMNVHISEGLETDFPQKLARSRFLLASFGYSFYEAVALKTFPVAWPLSDSHGRDARLFYENMGLPIVIVNGENDLERMLYPLCSEHELTTISLELNDGTPLIIREIKELLAKAAGESR